MNSARKDTELFSKALSFSPFFVKEMQEMSLFSHWRIISTISWSIQKEGVSNRHTLKINRLTKYYH